MGIPGVTHGNPASALETTEHNLDFMPLPVKVFIIKY